MCVIALVLAPAGASAAIRYAGPGGTGADPCPDPNAPCSIYAAASMTAPGTTIASGDEVVIAPGAYTDADLGPGDTVQLPSGVGVHGAAGEARPVIAHNDPGMTLGAAFIIPTGSIVSHIEITSSGARTDVLVSGGTLADSILRSTSNVSGTIPCTIDAGTIRDTVCKVDLTSNNLAAAVGVSIGRPAGMHTVTLRNVTAVATGLSTRGLSFSDFGGSALTVSAKSVIARGGQFDVAAFGGKTGLNCPCSSVTVNLDHSNYDTRSATAAAGGSAFVTDPSTGNNQTLPPQFTADGFHQLAASPTVDAGATDGSSGITDIDGQARVIATADIGADELAHATSTSVACAPQTVQLGSTPGSTTCTATVTDTTGAIAPTGAVSFSTAAPGSLSPGSCALVGTGPNAAACFVTYAPNAVGSGTHAVIANYPGDSNHEGSQGSGNLTVTPANVPPPPVRPQTFLKKKPPKRTFNRIARFTFRSNQAGAIFQCKLDRKPYRRCSSPFKRRVKPGKHVFRVRAVGPAGADKTPAIYRWRVLRRR